MTTKNDNDSTRSIAENRPSDGAAVVPDDGDDVPRRLGRRTFVKGLGAAGAAGAGLSLEDGFAQDAEAVVPLIAAGAVGIGASVSLGWALREFEIVGSDTPPEGLTADTLKQQVYQTARTRKSTNASTIVDNKNILDGVENTAYTEAKIAAIEALNEGLSESDVIAAGEDSLNSYFSTIERNLIKTWNESMSELQGMYNTAQSHTEINVSDVVNPTVESTGSDSWSINSVDFATSTAYTLPDNSTIQINQCTLDSEPGSTSGTWNTPTDWDFRSYESHGDYADTGFSAQVTTNSGDVSYMRTSDWKPLYDELQTKRNSVANGISTWVTNVYGQVQSGELEVSDLVTPRERAAMMADGEGTSQAIADLIALNQPVDAEREATVTFQSTGATLPGTFALTDSSDGPLEAGTTYDPSTFAGDVFFTADMSLLEGDWTAIQTGVDGGTITITSEPYEGTTIEVTTAASETVSVPAGDWTDNGDGTWSYDASSDLETQITNVSSARFVSNATETQYDTFRIQDSFTVDKLVNTQSGEEVTSTSFSNSEPQTDSNYITQDEWDQLEKQNKELIEKYENSQSGGGIDLGQFDFAGIPGEIVALGVAALAALYALGDE